MFLFLFCQECYGFKCVTDCYKKKKKGVIQPKYEKKYLLDVLLTQHINKLVNAFWIVLLISQK